MCNIFNQIYKLSQDKKYTMREAAYIISLINLDNAHILGNKQIKTLIIRHTFLSHTWKLPI